MFTGSNTTLDLDKDVGYLPSCEDLMDIDTEYILANKMTELPDINLNLMHLNICGLINKQYSLSRLLTTLGGRNKVNVVSLNETWLRNDTESKINIPGYSYSGLSRTGKKGGGVGFLISEELKFRECTIELQEITTLEMYCIKLKAKSNPVLIVSLYRPLNKPLQTSLHELKQVYQKLKNDKKPVILCTDHNLDLLKASMHAKTQEFLEITS